MKPNPKPEYSFARQQRNARLKARRSNAVRVGSVMLGPEDAIQAAFFEWIDLHKERFPALKNIFAVPNGTRRSKTQRHVMQITGLRPGVPDVFVAVPSGDKHGLWIEFKSKKRSVTPAQEDWIARLANSNYKTAVLRSWTDAVNLVIEYLGLEIEKL